MAEFLQIDADWLSAATSASPALPDHDTIDSDMDAWIALQTLESMQATTDLLLEGRSQEAERALRQRYLAWRRERSSNLKSSLRRTVAEIYFARAMAMVQAGHETEFQAGLVNLLSVHGKRGAWMKRLSKAGEI